MSSRSRLLIIVSSLLLACCAFPVIVSAQVPGVRGLGGAGRSGNRDQRLKQQEQRAQQQLQSLPQLQTTGTVEAVKLGYIKVNSAANQAWILQVLPNARCAVTGKANPEALSPGFYIRFVGEVNKRGAVEQKVGKLTLFTPSQFRQPGAEPDSGLGTTFGPRPGDDTKRDEKPKAAFGAGAQAPDLERAAGARKAGPQPGAGGKAAGPQVYDIRGQIVGSSNGRLSLHVPNAYFRPSLRVEIAEDADIDVELDDPMAYTLARKGDKVRIQGRQGMGNAGFAEELDIILSEPLGAPQPDGRKHAKGARSKRGDDADEPSDAKSADGKAEKNDADPADAKGKKADGDTPQRPTKRTKKAGKTESADDS